MDFERIIARFQRRGAARDVATLTIGTVIAQSITIAATPLLTRLYTPGDFGLLAIFMAVVSVGATLVTLRYETSILVPKRNAESANIVFLSFMLGAGLSLILAVLSIFIPAELQEKVGLGALERWLPIAFLVAMTTSALVVFQGWMNRQKKYCHMAWLRVAQSISVVCLALFLGVQNTSNGLLVAQILASICMCLLAMWFGRSAARLWRFQQLKKTALAHINAPKYMLPTALLDVITLQLPVVLIAAWFSADEAGQFSMAWRLLMVPMAIVGGAMSQVFMRRFSVAIENPDNAKEIIKRSWRLLAVIGLLPFALIFSNGDSIFSIILGERWLGSGDIAMTLAPMAFAMFVSSPTSGAYVILGLQKYSLIFGIITFIYRPICIFLGGFYGDLLLGLSILAVLEVIVIIAYQSLLWRRLVR